MSAILLQGELGAGKTTLVRGLVAALPGGNDAEVSSPSFNLLNLYPTQPETAHVDLYRLNGQEPDDTVAEVLEDDGRLVIVEWAQFLPERLLPPAHLFIRWVDAPQGGRRVRLDAVGENTYAMLERLQRDLRGSMRKTMRPEEDPKKVDR